MLNAIIVHGYHGSPKRDWIEWLSGELRERGLRVSAKQYPAPNKPKLSKWLGLLEKEVNSAKGDVILIGHSLGGAAVLRFLERYKGDKIKAVVLVAAAYEFRKHAHLHEFTLEPFDWFAINNTCKKFIVLHSTDDDVVPYGRAKRLAEKLNAQSIITRCCYHFNRKIEPKVLEAIEKAISTLHAKLR